jgi:hypothetical protein
MDDDEFFDHLQSLCAEAIETYREEYPEAPPLTERRGDGSDELLESDAGLSEYFVELTRFYDELFAVDSTPYRDMWQEHLVYDWSLRDRLGLLTSDLPASVSLVFIEGRYCSRTGWIGVSPGQLPEATACAYLPSELCHAYQHRFDSPTWTHPCLQEGFEQAASIRAQAHLGATHDPLAHRAQRQRVKTLLQGVLAHGTRRGGITPETVRELGVTDAELSALRAHPLKRPFGYLRPRYRWSDLAYLPEYALFGSMLLVSERLGVSSPFSRAFHGAHPWTALIDEITAHEPGWLWRWYHQ